MGANDFRSLRCRVIDQDEARTTTHREVLLIMAQIFDVEGAVILCEPSVVGARSGAPDIAIVDPESGVHVVEVKGVTLEQVRSLWPGGSMERHARSSKGGIRRASGGVCARRTSGDDGASGRRVRDR